jgi:hypothetical protein
VAPARARVALFQGPDEGAFFGTIAGAAGRLPHDAVDLRKLLARLAASPMTLSTCASWTSSYWGGS